MTAVAAAVAPDPVGWLVDRGRDLLGGVAGGAFDMVVKGLVGWVVGAVLWVVEAVFHFFFDIADPNVQADWFVRGTGPYATTFAIAGVLLVGFVLLGIVQGVMAGDVGGLLRRVLVELPLAVLAMAGLVTLTQALIRLTDELSNGLLAHFEHDVHAFTTSVVGLSHLSGGTVGSFVVLVLGVVTVLAGLILVAELVVRSALVYIVVALAPLAFAAQLWPALKGSGRKLVELLVALIVSKLVIAVARAVAAAAAVGAGSGGEVTALAPPEVVAESPGGSVGQAVGILLAAGAAFGVAAFSPLLVTKLLPFTEAAIVAHGIRSGPMRAGQQAMSAGYYAQASKARLSTLASHPPAGAAAGALADTAGGGAGNGSASTRRGPTTPAPGASRSVSSAARRPPSRPSPPRRRPPASNGGPDAGRG